MATNIDIQQIKEVLLSRKNLLTRSIESLQADKQRRRGPINNDFGDQAIELQNDEVVDRLEELDLNELMLVNQALIKIQNGTYGICYECGENISFSRLKALPYSRKCIHCEKENS